VKGDEITRTKLTGRWTGGLLLLSPLPLSSHLFESSQIVVVEEEKEG